MELLRLLLGCHIIGDYIFQGNILCKKKSESKLYLFLHSLIYSIPFSTLFFLSGVKFYFILLTIFGVFISHYFIDHIKIMNISKKNGKYFLYFNLDQLMHFAVLIIVWFIFRKSIIDVIAIDNFLIESGITISIKTIFNTAMVFFIVLKPTSIFIDMFMKYLDINSDMDINEKDEQKDENTFSESKINKNTSIYIGYLERILIIILSFMNVWTSIGFVLTAKSIARYKQLSEKNFAKKYIIGTLLSISISLLSFAFYIL